MLEHVQFESYNSELINKEGWRDGGVGVYVKDCLKYKIRKDVVNFEPHIEHI